MKNVSHTKIKVIQPPHRVDEDGNLASLVMAQFQATKNGFGSLYAV
jgi:hypothetical protein